MVLTISPQLGSEHKRADRLRTATLLPFAAGAVITGTLLFVGVAALGAAIIGGDGIRNAGSVGLAAVALAYGSSYIAGRPLPLPMTFRQVPKLWREAFSPSVAAFLYGLGLGLGFFTKVPYVTFYLAVMVAFLAATPAVGAVAGVAFALGRVVPLIRYRLQGVDLGDSSRVHDRIDGWRGHVQLANGVGLLGTVALGALLAA